MHKELNWQAQVVALQDWHYLHNGLKLLQTL
jgi:hypothetical protein